MRFVFRLSVLILGVSGVPAAQAPAPPAPAAPLVDPDALFRNPDASPDARLADLVSRLTPDEKIAALSTNLVVPRLGIPGARLVEGLHGLAYGGPSNWGSRNPMPTTIFPQAVGLGETWDVDAVRARRTRRGQRSAVHLPEPAVEPRRTRHPRAERGPRPRPALGPDRGELRRGSVPHGVARGRDDPRPAGRRPEVLAGCVADEAPAREQQRERPLIQLVGLRRAAASRVPTASPSAWASRGRREGLHGRLQQGQRRPVHGAALPARDDDEGLGARRDHLHRRRSARSADSAHHQYPTLEEGAAATIKAGITVFLDRYPDAVRTALDKGLLAWTDIDAALVRNFRVALKLGLLDPPARVPYAAIGKTGEDPWLDQSRHERRAPGHARVHRAAEERGPHAAASIRRR